MPTVGQGWQAGGMSSVYVRDVSESALTTLKARAARAGQSLQAYIRQLLEAEAATLTPEEAVKQARAIAARPNVNADDVRGAITEMRQARTGF